ncbi:multiple epidermal growth factor-like domains protein 10 [Saccostrea cucullata]|uniref:multiple epidermal growth factor-like domains protein 10 n=1 Tax=Saccostrea cuccullata TaxID=36930 RepID=UPI002ED5F3F9
MTMGYFFIFWIVCALQGVHAFNCSSGFQATILGTCADVNECQGSAPCTKGTCENTNGNYFCDDSQSVDKNKRVTCGSVTCDNFARCDANTTTCVCQPGYSGQTCSFKLPCDKMCRNNGTCDFLGTQEVCICTNGYTGSECQYSLDLCSQSTSVCLNNGSCVYGQFNKFPTCECQGGYVGLYCEAMTNCSALCYNGGSFPECNGTCPCNSSYYGDSCQYKVDCGCENGGVSVPDAGATCRCVCPVGTSGPTCAINTTNECSSSPCQNGGTCMDKTGYYTCQCPSEYTGYNCQVRCERDRNCIWKDCMQCKNKFANRVCDSECNNELCLYDGFDCHNTTFEICSGTYDNGTDIRDLAFLCSGYFDDNMCVDLSNATSLRYCSNESCGSDGLDCLSNKRDSSNILGVVVFDFVLLRGSIGNNVTMLNESTPTLFSKYLPLDLTVFPEFPGFFVRRLTTDRFNPGTGALMINPYPDFATSLKYRVFYNVVNKPGCGGVSSLPCWSNITSVTRYLALTAQDIFSTYIDSITEIFPCMEGYYGSRCAMMCSSNCQSSGSGRSCEMDTGKCISGCSSNSYTGDNCDIRCSSNCIQSCSHINGTCDLTSNNTRCLAGYQGLHCNETCNNDNYGIDCKFNCSSNCETGTCNTMTGHCTCKSGYTKTDPLCRTDCTSGTYGNNCTGTCNTCGMGVPCNKVDGSCSSCPAGKTGSMCNQDCADNYYGAGCMQKCSSNCAVVCDKTNGSCSSCKSGYEGMYCTTKLKSNDATLANPSSDMQSTIIAVVIIIVCLLVIAFVIGFILWRRNQGADYELNEVEPISSKKTNADGNGHAIEMQDIEIQDNLGTTNATVENEKMNGGEAVPLLEQSTAVYSGESTDVEAKPSADQENTAGDTSTEEPHPENTNIEDENKTEDNSDETGTNMATTNGSVPESDFKYIDGVESKNNSLDDVRETKEEDINIGGENNSELKMDTGDKADE